MKSFATKFMLLAETFANASNGFLISILMLAYANNTVFADFTILGTSVLGAKIFYQYSIINQFNLAKFSTLSVNYKTIYRFMVYTFFCLLTACTIIFFTLYFITNTHNFALIIFIAAEIIYVFFRANALKFYNYNEIFFSSILKSSLTAVLFLTFVDHDSNINQIYHYLAFSSFLSVIILCFKFNFNYSKIEFSHIKEDFLNTAAFQLPTGAVSWAKSSIPLIMLSHFFGDEKLIIFRTIQLIFAPFALACSIFESFLPQQLAKVRFAKEGRCLVIDQLVKSMIFVPVTMLLYLVAIYMILTFMIFSSVDKLNIFYIMTYSLFACMIPFNGILQIGLRYMKSAKTILIINIIEVIMMCIAILIIVNFLSLYSLIAYMFIAALIVNMLYLRKLLVSS